jgi:sporulation protein YlmC with PRC-barrel domain
MVEVSSLKELDIYTVTGHYVGRVADVILNIRLGTISKLQVRAIEPEKKQVGFRDLMKRSFQVSPEEDHDVRSFKNDLLTIDFDKVQAIGDIMLINPRDIKKVRHEPPVSEPISPNQQPQPQIPKQGEPKAQTEFEKF